MKYFKYIYLVLGLCSLHTLYAQTNQSGFLAPLSSKDYASKNTVYIPKEGFILYNKPQGEYTGRISKGMPHGNTAATASELDATIAWRGIRPQHLDISYFFKTSDDCFYIPFDRQEKGFVQIMDSPYPAWISVADIQKAGFKLVSWMDFYGTPEKMLTIPAGTTLPLRSSPYSDAHKILDLDDEHFTIRVIPFEKQPEICCEGLFCYVEVIQYKQNPCKNRDYSKKNQVKIVRGWLKIIDETGKRLIIHSVGGC